MDFIRYLDNQFVDALNECYEDESSWWHTVVEDPEAFIAVRSNCVNVYVYGQSLLRVTHSAKAGLQCDSHEDFLILGSPRKYVRLTSGETRQVPMVCGTDGLVRHYRRVKQRIARFAHDERAGENVIACRLPEVIDMEVAYGSSRAADGNTGNGRVDLVALGPSGRLVLVEAKLFSNPEFRGGREPLVAQQLQSYHRWQERNADKLVDAYRWLLDCYRGLSGSFFARRVSQSGASSVMEMYERPRLLVFGFNQEQKVRQLRGLTRRVRAATEQMALTAHDVVCVGNPQNVTARRLLAGV